MKFIDEATIEVFAGDGGNGCIAWRREKYVPEGGPFGGNGGEGGSVYLLAKQGLSTLMDIHYRKTIRADRGEHGRGKTQHGAKGVEAILDVPVGTMVYDSATGQLLGDLTTNGEKLLVAKGGRGGKGNANFKSSKRKAPDFALPGDPGEVKKLRLELKLLADVGLVGFPNAGKSTFISAISNAHPKVADYPFTTKVPHLGMVRLDYNRHFVVADIPGLIEGAHEGHGMGIQFLRHVERTKVLLHLIDVTDPERPDPFKSYQSLRQELGSYHETLLNKPSLLVLTKMDLPEARLKGEEFIKELSIEKEKVTFISAVTSDGVKELVNKIAMIL